MGGSDRLPSWRPGPTRDAILGFLDGVGDVPVDERVAYLDNDGTMWSEKPTYVQLDFFVDALTTRVADDPALAERPELAAVLDGDMAKVAEIGLPTVAGALAALFDGQTPEEFAAVAADFLARYRHPTRGVPIAGIVYQPMLELLDELRAHEFAIGIVTGGGTEFVRQVSRDALRGRARDGRRHPHRLRVRPRRRRSTHRPAHPGRHRQGQRGRGQGRAHLRPDRAGAPGGGRQLRRRPGDARVGPGQPARRAGRPRRPRRRRPRGRLHQRGGHLPGDRADHRRGPPPRLDRRQHARRLGDRVRDRPTTAG